MSDIDDGWNWVEITPPESMPLEIYGMYESGKYGAGLGYFYKGKWRRWNHGLMPMLVTSWRWLRATYPPDKFRVKDMETGDEG